MMTDNSILIAILRGGALAAVALLWIVLLVRLAGLRSFSKMTNFDFVMTVATGSMLASVAQSSSWPSLFQTMAAVASLFATQVIISRLRLKSDRFRDAFQNTPKILMRDGHIDEAALRETRVDRHDLMEKLRQANVRDLSKVRAVILETTGDVSVLHGEGLDDVLLTGVRTG